MALPRKIAIEGSISSGKTTLLKNLQEKLGSEVTTYSEPVKQWENFLFRSNNFNLLKRYYSEPDFAFPFQVHVASTLINGYIDILNTKNNNYYFFCERTLWTSYNVFAKMSCDNNNIGLCEMGILETLCKTLTTLVPGSNEFYLIVYLLTKPETCFQRATQRRRLSENKLTLQYLKLLHENYENWRKENFAPLHSDPFL